MRKFFVVIAIWTFTIVLTPTFAYAHILDDAVEFSGHYYKLFDQEMKWIDAKEYCESMGGHLLIAETPLEGDFIAEWIAELPLSGWSHNLIWIGGTRDSKGFFRWINGKFVTYSRWRKFYYIGATISEHDNAMYINQETREWGGFPEKYENRFICEWESADAAHESNW